jgi:hypothetical protein
MHITSSDRSNSSRSSRSDCRTEGGRIPTWTLVAALMIGPGAKTEIALIALASIRFPLVSTIDGTGM